ncbi:unnamed protein product [Aphanomyces euteiches]|uniref:Bile salt export pump n=1 Tax=Aphanomyces euteiches TaxID=100861 RepID=A0A6G0X403_9STRA|nr:hypothetical protein Ae201684_008749 [Aphanomyces euteiches]KAH9085983.1 hypothetical protein Ae201684P_005679 [Aphanomyces euteiches]
MSNRPTDEYKAINTPKDEVVEVEKPTVVKGADDIDHEFSFMSMYRYADRTDRLLMYVGLISAAANGAAFPFMAIIFGDSVNAFIPPIDFHKVNVAATQFLMLAVGLFVVGYLSFACFAIAAERQMKKLRSECLKHIMYQEMGWYDQRDASELASRISGDTVKIKEGMGQKLGEALRFVCQFFTGYGIGFYRGWNLSLVMACVMPLMAISLTFLIKRLRDSTARSQKVYAAAGAVAEETIGAIRTVASLNGEERAVEKYAVNVANAEKETIGVAKFVAFALGWFFMFIWLTYAIGLWYGGWLVSKQTSAVSDPGSVFSAFYGILMGTMSLAQISPNINAVASAKGAATALFKILARKSEIDASDLSGEIPADCEGNIEARDLHFTYPSRPEDPILRGYSLTIKKGETVAFVGASGSGKSTLVALLERFYKPTSGAIFLDGRDISTLQIKWLRSQIGLVSQEPVLFAATIFENISAGGYNISREEVIAAAKLANAHDFIMGLPEGYDTMCGEKGATLSGGQKQRVAIARALVRQPKILVLDEATSALDNESERVVQEALNNLMAHTNMTTIVIAHRLSTIRTADKIAVISKGVVAEIGRHEELMQLENGFYRSLVLLQSTAPTDEDDSHAVEEYEKRVSMALDENPEMAVLVRKYSSVSHVSVEKVSTYVGAVEEEVKLGRLFELTKPQRMYLIAGTIACSLQGFAMPGVALIISTVISDMNKHYADYLASGKKDKEPLTALYDDISHSSFIFIGVAVAMFFAAYVNTYSFRIIAEKLTSRLRNMHFKALMRQDIGFFDLPGNTTGALTTDLSTHATKVVVIAGDNQAKMLQTVFTIISAFFIAFFWGSWKLTLVMAATFPLLLIGSWARAKQFKGENFSDNLADSGSLATEAITNARTVTAFGLQKDFIERYDVLLDKPLKEGSKEAHINGLMEGFASFSMFGVYALVFWYGARLMNDGSITFKELMNTLMAIMMASQGVGQTAGFMGDTDAAKKSASKIFSIVDRQPPVDSSSTDGLKPESVTGRIEFNDVFFHYPSRPDVKVLKHYDLTIEPGQTVAFCGPSGGGKSTCVALLERFYNPVSGSIALDGRDISTLNLHWLRSQIGLVGQEPVLFVGTIAENIASGISDYTSLLDLQERVEEAAKMANAHNFIMQFPDGYQTQVGLKGEQLSGGQKQRIAIARAIMKNPSILLLDEATSALDSESEKVVQEALDKLLAAKGRTTIVIAHRLSTIRNADKICVVSGGRIAEQGTHDELIRLNGIYTHLVKTNTKH